MNVTIRKRPLTAKGRYALYLDIYVDGKQRQKNLGLYLENEKNDPVTKQKNKETWEIARKVQVKTLSDLQHKVFGFKAPVKSVQTFNQFFDSMVKERKKTGVNYDGWLSAQKQLDDFKDNIEFYDVTEDLLEEFKSHLLKKVKQNTALSYFSKVKAAVHKAYRENLIYGNVNPADKVKPPRQLDTNREYLTKEEIEKLAATECRYDVLKRAFLFSCLTGLRWSDIQKLTWGEVINGEGQHYIKYTQKKTKSLEVLPISKDALAILGRRQDDSEKVFKNLIYSAYLNAALLKWVANAGIKKHITFHCGRHTNAVLLLNNGTDIFTVSKMLGHKELKTTQIYAKVMNETKIDAIMKLPKFDFAVPLSA